jgi:hypothetical protein
VIGIFEVAVALVAARVGGDEVVCVIEAEMIGKSLEGDALRRVEGRHGVTVGVQHDAAAGGDSNGICDGGVGGHRRQRTQGGLFDEEEFGGLFAGFAVDAHVGDCVHPVACRRVHGTDGVGQLQSGEEVFLHITDGVFDPALFIGFAHVAGTGLEAVMGGEVQIARIEYGAFTKAMAQHTGLEVVYQDDAGGAAKELQGIVVASEEVFRGLAAGELHIGHAAVAEDHDEEGEAAARVTQGDDAGTPPVHLCGFAGSEGKAITTQLCVILDDHSRLITHAAYYLTGDTVTFLDSLKQAVLRRGLPHKLYTDQGKPFVSNHTRVVCANLGIRLLHAKPYHAWSKGKVERLIRTIQGDFEATLRLEDNNVHSLAGLNTALSRWIETIYHLRSHSSTGMSPHHRFTSGAHPLRHVEEPDKIDPFFYTRSERVVRKDGTVTLGKTLYEVHLSLRALAIELRYNPLLLDRVEVWHKGSFHGLAAKANLHLNSQTYNRSHNYERPAHS